MNTKQGLVSPINRGMETGKISSPSITANRKRAPSKEKVAIQSPGAGRIGKSLEACSNYQLDMSASTFGVCICGHPRAQHQLTTGKQKGTSELDKKLANRMAQ